VPPPTHRCLTHRWSFNELANSYSVVDSGAGVTNGITHGGASVDRTEISFLADF